MSLSLNFQKEMLIELGIFLVQPTPTKVVNKLIV